MATAKNETCRLTDFLGFAVQSLHAMRECIAQYPPMAAAGADPIGYTEDQMMARWRLYLAICPREFNAKQTPLALAIAEVRQHGELLILGPRLEALDVALRGCAYAFLYHRQGNSMPAEAEALNDAINALMPYTGAASSDSPQLHAMTQTQMAQMLGCHTNTIKGWARAALRERAARKPAESYSKEQVRRILEHGKMHGNGGSAEACQRILVGSPTK